MKINNLGNSLIEIIVALAMFMFLVSSLSSLILGSLSLAKSSGDYTTAEFLAQEGIEAVLSIKSRAWNELNIEQSAVKAVEGEWLFVGEGTIEQIADFSRFVTIGEVYRDDSDDIIASTSPSAKQDSFTKEIKSTITWTSDRANVISYEVSAFVSNWNSLDFEQTDWSGGDGQQIWSSEDKFYIQNSNIDISRSGEISLLEIATSTFATSAYIESSAYDMGDFSQANAIKWAGEIDQSCSTCEIRLQVKTADDNSGSPAAWSSSWCGPNGEDGNESDYFTASSTYALIHTDNLKDQWVKYKATLIGDGAYSPILESIHINYKR